MSGQEIDQTLRQRDAATLDTLGGFLRSAFADVTTQALPSRFQKLLDHLAAKEKAHDKTAETFRNELAAVIPQLRAYGRSLSGSPDTADDLVQETLLKAWAARDRFEAGTNIRAWTFIILKNQFLSEIRRERFKGEWDEMAAERLLSAPATQDKRIELSDLQRALQQLPAAQRDALILVGAGGFAYEEAAAICACAVGTIKSRVARGRVAIEAMISEGKLPSRRLDPQTERSPMEVILGEVDHLSKD